MMAKFYNLNFSPKYHDLLGKGLEFSLYDKTILSKALDVLLKIFNYFGSVLEIIILFPHLFMQGLIFPTSGSSIWPC
jgi:hypothetical protein